MVVNLEIVREFVNKFIHKFVHNFKTNLTTTMETAVSPSRILVWESVQYFSIGGRMADKVRLTLDSLDELDELLAEFSKYLTEIRGHLRNRPGLVVPVWTGTPKLRLEEIRDWAKSSRAPAEVAADKYDRIHKMDKSIKEGKSPKK